MKKITLIPAFLATLIFIFFFPSRVEATHEAIVEPIKKEFNQEQTVDLEFNIEKKQGTSLGAVKLYIPSGFNIKGPIICPAGFQTQRTGEDDKGKFIKCAMGEEGKLLQKGSLMLRNATTPIKGGKKKFIIETMDADFDKTEHKTGITIQRLKANISFSPEQTNIEQTKDYKFLVKNTGEDSIDKVKINVAGLDLLDCRHEKWDCAIDKEQNSLILSGNELEADETLEVLAKAQSPAEPGGYPINAFISGVLGGEKKCDAIKNKMRVQTPARLELESFQSKNKITSKHVDIDRQTIIEAKLKNSGQTEIDQISAELQLRDTKKNNISEQFRTELLEEENISEDKVIYYKWRVAPLDSSDYHGRISTLLEFNYSDKNTAQANINSPYIKKKENVFMVDSTPPEISKLKTSAGIINTGRINIEFDISEALADLPRVSINESRAEFMNKAGNHYTFGHIIKKKEKEGMVDISIQAIDPAGNQMNFSNNELLEIDQTPPQIRIIKPSKKKPQSGEMDLLMIASDPNNDFDLHYSYNISNSAINGEGIMQPNKSKKIKTDISDLEGKRKLKVEISDKAGNIATSSRGIIINNNNTLTVNKAGGADFETVQEAINYAGADDVISVSPGIYKEDLKINKKVCLQGAGEQTIIKPLSGNPTINASLVTIKDMKFDFKLKQEKKEKDKKRTGGSSSGGGGGGGGGIGKPAPKPPKKDDQKQEEKEEKPKQPKETKKNKKEPSNKQEEQAGETIPNKPAPKEKIEKIKSEAEKLITEFLENKGSLDKDKELYAKYIIPLLNEHQKEKASNETVNILYDFIVSGTPSTVRLGMGERAGVANSFASCFKKLPKDNIDWQDVIKIANGRWPSQRMGRCEEEAGKTFEKIYLRRPDMDNRNDNAAVTVMAYGLRPTNRNMNSEKRAIKIFKNIFDHPPLNAPDWDAVRAIAYSGTKR